MQKKGKKLKDVICITCTPIKLKSFETAKEKVSQMNPILCD